MYNNLAILAALIFGYSIIAKRFESSIISGPIIFVTVGLLMGPLGLGFLFHAKYCKKTETKLLHFHVAGPTIDLRF